MDHESGNPYQSIMTYPAYVDLLRRNKDVRRVFVSELVSLKTLQVNLDMGVIRAACAGASGSSASRARRWPSRPASRGAAARRCARASPPGSVSPRGAFARQTR